LGLNRFNPWLITRFPSLLSIDNVCGRRQRASRRPFACRTGLPDPFARAPENHVCGLRPLRPLDLLPRLASPLDRRTCFRGLPDPSPVGPASAARQPLRSLETPRQLPPASGFQAPSPTRRRTRPRPPPVSGSPDLPPRLASPLARRNHLRDRRMLAAPLPLRPPENHVHGPASTTVFVLAAVVTGSPTCVGDNNCRSSPTPPPRQCPSLQQSSPARRSCAARQPASATTTVAARGSAAWC
jgi:hypothetical protein